MQFNGPDKKESRKSSFPIKYAFIVKQNKKWMLVLLKYNLKLEKEVNTKI